jgi:hypothetical protein
MAVPYIGHLRARLRARFHVQAQVSHSGAEFRTPAAIPVKGRIVRVFRSGGALRVGDEVMFSVNVCRPNDEIPPGPAFMPYETFIRATHMEVYLNGEPPMCEVALDERVAIDGLSRAPWLRASWFAYVVELIRWKFY